MLTANRVIWNDNGVLKDISAKLNNFFSETQVIPFVAAEDKLYVGSDVPFNHRFIKSVVANDVASVATVEIWDGNSWVAAVDLIDRTSVNGVALAQSGILEWVTDRNKTWASEASTEKMTGSGLETLKIYNLFWVRIGYSGNMKSTTEIKYVGHKFSKDEDLGGYYPDLNRTNVKTSFQSGKTDWDEQHILAAEEIYKELRKRKVAWAKGQIFTHEAFTNASVHKVAQIIYTSFGEDYDGRRDEAESKFESEMDNILMQGVDYDGDGHIDQSEHFGGSISLRRV